MDASYFFSGLYVEIYQCNSSQWDAPLYLKIPPLPTGTLLIIELILGKIMLESEQSKMVGEWLWIQKHPVAYLWSGNRSWKSLEKRTPT